ncbi:MAG: hypothetical protein LV479_01805 [Methylacidiphilales bacterium]|nr:hypothetical protein [Candidatus Methylacidiphilales bacterium]
MNFRSNRVLLALFILVLLATGLLISGGLLSDNAVPYGDGEHYALRALSLYGFLHTGQWMQFWNELTVPGQSLLPPHYLLFFLVPPSLASVAVYGIIQTFVTCALLAFGSYSLCRALDRPSWSPALFLLCLMQNVSLDASYFYFADTPFLAVVTIALAWQISAWRDCHWCASLLSGIGAALPFWIKPANALLFFVVFVLTEILRLLLNKMARHMPPQFLPHLGFLLLGFIPLVLAALLCGGLQSIVYLVNANETSGLFVTHLECTGLFRLLYFPLCLTFFYQTELLLFIAFLVALIAFWLKGSSAAPPSTPSSPFPEHLLLPSLIAFTAFGLFFSFGITEKEMRGLLMMLPVLWLGLFWALDRWKISPPILFAVAALYTFCAALQIFCGTFGGGFLNSGSYQLSDDWLSRFPPKHIVNPNGASLTRNLLAVIRQSVPGGGKIAVGTEQMFLTSESLTWMEQRDTALRGQSPLYHFNNFLTNQGKYSRPALLDARAILLILHPNFQYSQQVQTASNALAQFAYNQWMLHDHSAQVIPIALGPNTLLGVLIAPNEPLTDSRITQVLTATGAQELADPLAFSASTPKRFTFGECWQILFRGKSQGINP